MRRFQVGDLAVVVNSAWPLVNNGHVVIIRRVLGPLPSRRIAYGYSIERIDGQPFPIAIRYPERVPAAGGPLIAADQYYLRPIAKRPHGASRPTAIAAER